ncbi:MAG: protein kinase [Planctomycetes bacterium]|nr:protein kinase [Planctomycetota bacterium]
MPDCPADTELAEFLNDALAADRVGLVGGHVDSCPRCQARLDRLTDQTSGAVARYKELSSRAIPDARSGAGSVSGTDTHVLGKPPPSPSKLIGLPRVRGFEVVGEIGRGGMGVVYKARHLRLNRLVALKMILAGSAADSRNVQRFLFEAEFLAKIRHPQVVQVFEIDMYQGPNAVPIPYIAMELLEGGSLNRRLKQNAAEPGGAPQWPTPRGAAELIEGMARAVHAAHLQGVVHRDLKPGNILFDKPDRQQKAEERTRSGRFLSYGSPPPPPPLAKVTDFGLAKFTQDAGADLTHSGQIVGTPAYMAPEQASGGRQVTPAVDVYALGAILFECLAGRPPFIGSEPISVLMKVVHEAPPNVRSLRPDVPRDLAAVTMKCLEKDPARRYPSAEALADDLRRFLDDRPTRARPVRNYERVRLWAKRNPVVAGLIAALVAVLALVLVALAALLVQAEQRADAEQAARTEIDEARGRAEHEAANAAAALREAHRQNQAAQRQEALLEFGRAVVSCEEGRVTSGLTQFLRTVELAERTGQADLARVARVNLAAWPRDLPPPPRTLAHKFQPRLAVFHPDGRHLATAGRGGGVFLWDLAAGKQVRAYKPPPSTFRSLVGNEYGTFWTAAISPDGKTVAAGGTDGTVTLWNVASDEIRATVSLWPAPLLGPSPLTGTPPSVWTLGFASDDTLWTNDDANGLLCWDLTDGPRPTSTRVRPKTPPRRPQHQLQVLAVSADRTRLFTGDREGAIREWDARKRVEVRAWQRPGWITDVAVSADGTRLAATGTEGVVWVIDLTTGEEVCAPALAGAYGNGVAFAPKRPYLVTTDGDGNVRFWHRDTGQPIGIPLRLRGEVTRPRFRPNSDEFAVPAGAGVCVCTLPDPPGDVLSAGRGSRVRGLDYSPDGRLAVADEAGAFEVFDLRARKRVQFAPEAWPSPLCVRFDPVRPVVYRGVRNGFDRLAVPDGRQPEWARASVTLGKVFHIECLPGGRGVLAMGTSAVARFDPVKLTATRAEPPARDVPPGVELGTMALRPDAAELLVSFGDRVAFLQPDTLAPIREWKAGDEVLDARYTPDGKKVLIGRRDNVAELLDATNGKPTSARPMPHERGVTAVAVAPDGRVLLTGSRDGTARYWDPDTGLPLGAPMRHTGPVTHVAFSPTGDHIATGTGTGHVTIWDLPPPPAKGTIEELRAKLGPK